MKVTREMVLGAEMCTGLQVSPDNEELNTIHVVPRGEYEDMVLCFCCLSGGSGFWYPRSHEWYGNYWDSEMMLAQIECFSNEEALALLEEMDAFDCPCVGFEEEKNESC